MEHEAINPNDFDIVLCDSSSSCSSWLRTASSTEALTRSSSQEKIQREDGDDRNGKYLLRTTLSKHYDEYAAATNKTEQTRAIRKVMCDPMLSSTRFVTKTVQRNHIGKRQKNVYVVVSNRIVRQKISHFLSVMKAQRKRRTVRRRQRDGVNATPSVSTKSHHPNSNNDHHKYPVQPEPSDDVPCIDLIDNSDAPTRSSAIPATTFFNTNAAPPALAPTRLRDYPRALALGGLDLLSKQPPKQPRQQQKGTPGTSRSLRHEPRPITTVPNLQSFALPQPPSFLAPSPLAQSNSRSSTSSNMQPSGTTVAPVNRTPFDNSSNCREAFSVAATNAMNGDTEVHSQHLYPPLLVPQLPLRLKQQQQLEQRYQSFAKPTHLTNHQAIIKRQPAHDCCTAVNHTVLDLTDPCSIQVNASVGHATDTEHLRLLSKQQPQVLIQQYPDMPITTMAIMNHDVNLRQAPTSAQQQQQQQQHAHHDSSTAITWYDSNTLHAGGMTAAQEPHPPSWQIPQQHQTMDQQRPIDVMNNIQRHPCYQHWDSSFQRQEQQHRNLQSERLANQHNRSTISNSGLFAPQSEDGTKSRQSEDGHNSNSSTSSEDGIVMSKDATEQHNYHQRHGGIGYQHRSTNQNECKARGNNNNTHHRQHEQMPMKLDRTSTSVSSSVRQEEQQHQQSTTSNTAALVDNAVNQFDSQSSWANSTAATNEQLFHSLERWSRKDSTVSKSN